MQTLPQIILYTRGTQLTSSHGYVAYFGAYVSINIVMIYMALQRWRGNFWMSGGLADGGWKYLSEDVWTRDLDTDEEEVDSLNLW